MEPEGSLLCSQERRTQCPRFCANREVTVAVSAPDIAQATGANCEVTVAASAHKILRMQQAQTVKLR
jgi:hypothetical protein